MASTIRDGTTAVGGAADADGDELGVTAIVDVPAEVLGDTSRTRGRSAFDAHEAAAAMSIARGPARRTPSLTSEPRMAPPSEDASSMSVHLIIA
jgi:hypothetical protein